MKRLLALGVLVPWLVGCGGSAVNPSQRGVLTGEIRFVGAIAPRGGIGPKPGNVIVFMASGRILARQQVDRASHLQYRFVLPPGEYGVNAGALVRYDYPRNCRPQRARVRPGRTARVNVYVGCGII